MARDLFRRAAPAFGVGREEEHPPPVNELPLDDRPGLARREEAAHGRARAEVVEAGGEPRERPRPAGPRVFEFRVVRVVEVVAREDEPEDGRAQHLRVRPSLDLVGPLLHEGGADQQAGGQQRERQVEGPAVHFLEPFQAQ